MCLITGPAAAGKSGVVTEKLRRAASRGEGPVLVLPADPDVARSVEEYARKGVSGVRISQFDRWIEGLWHLYGDGRKPVRTAMRSAVATSALGSVLGEEGVSRGLVELLAALARQAPDVSRGPVEFRTEPFLAQGYRNYCQELENRGLIEPMEMVRVLSDTPPELPGPVGLNHFTGLPAACERLALSLAGQADVSVALTWEEGLAATEALSPLVSRLLAAGAEHTVVTDESWTDPHLRDLSRALFSGVEPLRADGALRLVEAGGTDGECHAIARRVRELVDGGAAEEEIAVTARDMGSRANRLVRALSSHGITCSLDVSLPFRATAFGGAMMGLLEAVGDPSRARERLLAFVSSPFSGMDPAETAEIDRSWRRWRASAQRMYADVTRSAVSVPVRRLLEQARQGGRPAELEAFQWNNMAILMLGSAAERDPSLSVPGSPDLAAHRLFLRVIGELAQEGEGRLSSATLERSLANARVGTGSTNGSDVLLTDAHRLTGRRFDTVIVMGLTAFEFSADRPESLASALLGELPGAAPADIRAEERMLFYSVVTRARARLVLSRTTSDDRGEAIRPSVFWEEVVDRYGGSERLAAAGVSKETDSADGAPESAPSYSDGRRERRRRAAGRAVPAGATVRGAADGIDLSADLDGHEFSASEIERYLACPYWWFVERALRPREIDSEFDARAKGTVAHALLASFYERWGSTGAVRVTPETLGAALEVYAELEREHRDAWKERIVGLAEEVSLDRAMRQVRATIVDDASLLPGFQPAGHEVEFGRDAGVPLTFGGVPMAGRIDRIETGPAGVLAIDYKSKADVVGVRSFATRGLVQATVYAAAAQALTGRRILGGVYRSLRTQAVRGFWRADELDFGGRETRSDGLEEEDFAAEIERAETVVAEAVEAMCAGRITPDPASPSTCDHCPARGMCGVS